ncbi:MAG: septum formation inhibitor Maf [Gammaproteobacteria bacterium]|nr:septum formation inhibitor Maf [Gammaproteobacteria bacterium]MBU1416034.1 septum formation inhibitor Maf [Gammaproteobacteria bacterium]
MNILPARIYLASRSPRRRELLAQIGVQFDLLLFRGDVRHDPEVNEDRLPDEPPEAYVCRLARSKAQHGIQLIKERGLVARLVLSADTTLDVDGEVIGKPRDEADAVAILQRLSGRTHFVLTAVAIANERRVEHALSVSEVGFRALQEEEILRYVHTGEPLDKAGAYGIQGRAAMFVESIRGSHSGIVGLPLCETTLLLREFHYPI